MQGYPGDLSSEHADMKRYELYILSPVATYLAYLALGFSICKSAHDVRN